MSKFTTATEESIEELQQFKAWAGRKIANQSGELAGLRVEVRQIRRLLDSINGTFTVSDSCTASPVFQSLRPVAPSNVAHVKGNGPFVSSQMSFSPLDGGKDAPSGDVPPGKDIYNQDDGVEHNSKLQQCWTPRDPTSFKLTFTETETQEPPPIPYDNDDEDEGQTQPPSLPYRVS